MLTRKELREIIKARMDDAEALFAAGRYDGAIYLCGYAVELGLKLQICKTLHWPAFPSTDSEFRGYGSFKVHNLDVLLSLSGAEKRIKKNYLSQWSEVAKWDPTARYKPIGEATDLQARRMIDSAKVLLSAL